MELQTFQFVRNCLRQIKYLLMHAPKQRGKRGFKQEN